VFGLFGFSISELVVLVVVAFVAWSLTQGVRAWRRRR
jgi:hypothetical protein